MHELKVAELLRSLAEFAGTVLSETVVERVLEELATRLTELLELDGAAVLLVQTGAPVTVTAVPSRFAPLDSGKPGSGPCAAALRLREPVAIADLAEWDREWPEYVRGANEAGVHAVAVVPMGLRDQVFGAVAMYATAARDWTLEELELAEVLGELATGFLVNSAKLARQTEVAAQLERALESRVVIEQAKGVLAVQEGVSVEEAFERMRSHARRHQTKVEEVARAMVNLGLRL